MNEVTGSLSVIDYLQGAYYVVIGGVAILTYLSAKKTLFQPLRAEVFKSQLISMQEIFDMLVGKQEHELGDKFHFDLALNFNTLQLYDEFAKDYFNVKREYENDVAPYMLHPKKIISEEYLLSTSTLVTEHTRTETKDRDFIKEPTIVATKWINYKYEITTIPNQMDEALDELRRIYSNPLLPKDLTLLLVKLERRINDNVSAITELLSDIGKDLPTKYPNLDELRKSDFAWIQNEYIERFEKIEPISAEIVKYIRNYLGSDKIFEV